MNIEKMNMKVIQKKVTVTASSFGGTTVTHEVLLPIMMTPEPLVAFTELVVEGPAASESSSSRRRDTTR